MKRKFGIMGIALVLVLSLSLVPAVPVAAAPTTLTLVSSTATETAGYTTTDPVADPLNASNYSGSGSWSAAVDLSSPHTSWYDETLVTPAVWVSSADSPEGNTANDQWRLFKEEFEIPAGAIITSASLVMSADNSVEAYLNVTSVGTADDAVFGAAPGPPFSDPADYHFRFLWGPFDLSTEVGTGTNTLMFVVRNWGSSGGNPTGLLYSAVIEYEEATLTTLTPPEAFNPVGTTHTVYATIVPPVAGVPITFTVSGANTASGTENTNASGVAEFTYTGTNPGEDTITATLGDVTLSVTKYWLEHFVTGGGIITEGKGKTAAKVTFGGNVGYDLEGNMVGNWNIVFHNVIENSIYKGHFKATEITQIGFFYESRLPDADPPDADYNYAHFNANGTLNGVDGYRVRVNVTDCGEGNSNDRPDQIRIRLYQGSTPIYDTSAGDFPNAYPASRTNLDGGNIQIHPPEIPEL